MSLRAELLRVGLRWMIKRYAKRDITLDGVRRPLKTMKRFVPNPPKGTQVRRVEAGGVKAVQVAMPDARSDRHVLYFHGGAYVFGSPSHYRDFIWRISAATAASVLCIDYRLAPEHPFPAAVEDAAAAYQWLLADGADPRRIAFMGDSAGGGLVFASMLLLRDKAIALPAAAVALSPWTDLAITGQSIRRNVRTETILSPAQTSIFTSWYLAGADARHPYASPLYGDLAGFPPSLIHVGSDEMLLDDAVRMAERLRGGGCSVELEIWPRMPHVWHLFARVLPEGKRAIARVGNFVQRRFAEA